MRRDLGLAKYNIMLLFVADVQENYPADESKEIILESLGIYCGELERQVQGKHGDLAILVTVKRGIRLASVLLDALQETAWEHVREWHYGKQSVNPFEQLWGLLQQLVMDLTMTVFFTEAQYPEMKSDFDAERQAYHEDYVRRRTIDRANGREFTRVK